MAIETTTVAAVSITAGGVVTIAAKSASVTSVTRTAFNRYDIAGNFTTANYTVAITGNPTSGNEPFAGNIDPAVAPTSSLVRIFATGIQNGGIEVPLVMATLFG